MSFGIGQPTSFLLSKARFQRDYLWDVILPDIGISAGGLVGFGLSQLVQEVSFGDYNVDSSITMRYGPYESNFPGLFKVENIRMKILKTMPDIVSSYFNSWKKLMISETGLYQPKNNYQRNISIRFTDMIGLTLGEYKFIGCFPVKFPSYSLSYEQNRVTQVDVEFEVDKVEYNAF
jgi:hypothetical protein